MGNFRSKVLGIKTKEKRNDCMHSANNILLSYLPLFLPIVSTGAANSLKTLK